MKKATIRRMFKAAVTVMAVSFASLAFSGSDDVDDVNGFQALQWGAAEKDVYDKYRGKIRKAKCTPATESFAKLFNSVCDKPVMDNYAVVGIPFTLDFGLAADTRRLQSASLAYSEKTDGAKRQPWSQMQNEWWIKVVSIRNALIDKYGRPGYENFSSPAPQSRLAMAEAVWSPGTTRITLSAKISKGGGYAESWQDFAKNYRPISGGGAAKL